MKGDFSITACSSKIRSRVKGSFQIGIVLLVFDIFKIFVADLPEILPPYQYGFAVVENEVLLHAADVIHIDKIALMTPQETDIVKLPRDHVKPIV